jgi:phage gp16-like protein
MRAAVIYKTKGELRTMSAAELRRYLSWLRQRVSWLRGPGRKAVQQRVEVAQKIQNARVQTARGRGGKL